jgi:hypothetical protein
MGKKIVAVVLLPSRMIVAVLNLDEAKFLTWSGYPALRPKFRVEESHVVTVVNSNVDLIGKDVRLASQDLGVFVWNKPGGEKKYLEIWRLCEVR